MSVLYFPAFEQGGLPFDPEMTDREQADHLLDSGASPIEIPVGDYNITPPPALNHDPTYLYFTHRETTAGLVIVEKCVRAHRLGSTLVAGLDIGDQLYATKRARIPEEQPFLLLTNKLRTGFGLRKKSVIVSGIIDA